MYTDQEKERINQQKIYDTSHYIEEGVTIWEWKQKFLNDLFVIESYWEKEVEKQDGTSTIKMRIKCKENDKNKKAYLVERTIVNPKNFGIAKAVRKQVIIYNETISEEEIANTCNEIIMKAVAKYNIKDDCLLGLEINQLASYIITCLDTEMQNYINEYTGTIRSRAGGEENIFSPKLMMSYDRYIDEHDKNNDDTYKDYLSEEENLFYIFEQYKPTETLKIILDTISSDLTEDQKELMKILAVTENNNAETGRIIKELDIERGNELRKSDDAYRVFVAREKDKILKLVEENIDLHNIENVTRLKLVKDGIDNFLNADLSEKDVIDYVIENINEVYVEEIVYDYLDIELRQHLIFNFFHNYNEDRFNDKEIKAVCRYILKGLYDYIEKLNTKIKELSSIAIKQEQKQVEIKKIKPKKVVSINTYKYYVQKDKFEELKAKKLKQGQELKVLGEEKIKVRVTRLGIPTSSFEMECYYLGEYTARNKPRKTKYNKITPTGITYSVEDVQ